jgi:hypothetical protein
MNVMTGMVDDATVRQHLETISKHAVELAKSSARPGVLQLCCLSPHNGKLIPHRFRLDDVEEMIKTAVGAAEAGLNVYIEARTLRLVCGATPAASLPTPNSCSA